MGHDWKTDALLHAGGVLDAVAGGVAGGFIAKSSKKVKDTVDSSAEPEQGTIDRKTGQITWDKKGKKR